MSNDLLGGLFGEDDHHEKQLEIMQHQLDEHKEKLDRLDGIDTPEANKEREDVASVIHQLQVSIEKTREAQEVKADQEELGQARGIDAFKD